LVAKYRQKVFTKDDIVGRLKLIVKEKAESQEIGLLEQKCGDGHIHILLKAKLATNLTTFINLLKGHSYLLIFSKNI
jgi:REP element-mobilizing transposase RayT